MKILTLLGPDDFETGFGNWTNATGDVFDWTRNTGGTGSSGTGPSSDHTTGSGYYLYTEASSPRSAGALASATCPPTSATTPRGATGGFTYGSQARHSLNEFSRIVAESGAGPTLHVRYQREAYASVVDDYARVCFDRRIGAQRTESWDLDPDPYGWREFDHYWRPELADRSVVLELKCQSTIPPWISDLVRRHSLSRTSFSKYSTGIHLTRRINGERKRPTRDAKVMV